MANVFLIWKSWLSIVLCPQEVQKAVLYVFSAVTKETFPLLEAVIVLSSCGVSTLMSFMCLKLGVPVSAFRLFTVSGCPLYNCNLLCDYHLKAGKKTSAKTSYWLIHT